MELNKISISFITALSIIVLIILDIINITSTFEYKNNINDTISNMITFISILIGFISTIYIMLQSMQNGYVFTLLRKNNLVTSFNNSFMKITYIGFINVILLITLTLFSDSFPIFKILSYFTIPTTVYFLLVSNNIIATIVKIIISEEILKNKDEDKVTSKDLKNI